MQLSLQLAGQTNNSPVRNNDEVAVSAQLQSGAVPQELMATVRDVEKVFLDTTGKYDKDRVYCMVPFIWNPKIYDVSELS